MPIIDNPLTALNLRKMVHLILVPVFLMSGTLLCGTLIYTLGTHLRQAMTEDSVRTATQFAATAFPVEKIAAIQPELTIGTPYHSLVVQLKWARKMMPKARSVYILQRSNNLAGWKYIASTNTFDTGDVLDINVDGKIDPSEEPPMLGTPYLRDNFPMMLSDAFQKGTLKEHVAVFQSGSLIFAYAPMRNSKGEIEMLLGADAHIQQWTIFSARVFLLMAGIMVLGLFLIQSASVILRKKNISMEKQMDAERLALMELATHQLGAPLATFRWWLELVKDPEISETIEKEAVVEQVGDAVNRLDGIVKALSNATKVGLGQVKLEEQVLGSLKHIILRAVQEVTPRLKTQCLQIRVLYDDSIGPVKVDSQQFFDVVKEVIDNAISFSPANTVITVQVGKRKNMCQVDVSDQGYGIPEDDMHRVTEKFFRARNASKYKPVGNGMGLFIVKGIIEKHGGRMSIVSREGKGTTVSFTLRLATKKESEEELLA